MSVDATSWAWRQDVRGTKKLVLLCLADWANAESECWYSVAAIVERCCVGRSAVFDALRDLEAEGFLQRTERFRENGSRTSNVYVLCLSGRPDSAVRMPDGPPSGEQDPQNRQEEPVEEKESDDSQKDDPVADVWATYVEVIRPRQRDLDPGGRKIIRDALKVASVDECKRAILGCSKSDWHMGRDPRTNGRSYKQLSQILKGKRGGRTTREQIDLFLEIADKAGLTTGRLPSADPAKVSQAKRQVLTAWEFPGDEHSVARGTEAKRWLAEHGWKVEPDDDDGRPRFTWEGAA